MSERRDTESLGAFVRLMRTESRDTQKLLAMRIGTYERRISNIENGHREPTMGDLVCLAHAFDIHPTELYSAMDKLLTAMENEDHTDPSG